MDKIDSDLENDAEADDRAADPADKAVAKAVRIARERLELLASVKASDLSTLKTRVAGVLNLFPATRDSDIALSIRYWEMFQPDLFGAGIIKVADLFKLERETHLVRVRALIQNDYGLFVASEAVRGHRRQNEVTIKAEVLSEPAERPVLRVFADETGKNGRFVMVAAVWVLSGIAVFKISQAIAAWKKASTFANREVHFSQLGKGDARALADYLKVVRGHLEYLSFKVIGVERAKTKRSIAEVVAKLHEQMLMKGIHHEVKSGRVDMPRTVEVTIDEEASLDDIALTEMKVNVEKFIDVKSVLAGVSIGDFSSASSRHSPLLQLADVVAGALNRLRNHDGDRNFKDDYADVIVRELGLLVDEGEEDFDAATVLRL